MKFITNRIHIAPVSMEDAVAKAKEKVEPRSLDEVLASIAEGNKQVKTASKETKEAGCSCGAKDCPTCGEGCTCGTENGEHDEKCAM